MITLARFRSACDRRLIPANVPVQRQAMKRHKGSQKAFCRSSIVCVTTHAYETRTFWKFLPTRCAVRPSIPMAQAHCGASEIQMKIRGQNDMGFMELKLILLLWSYRSCMDLLCVVGMIPFGRKSCKISISEKVSLQTDARSVFSKIAQFTQNDTRKWHPKWSRSLKMTP